MLRIINLVPSQSNQIHGASEGLEQELVEAKSEIERLH